MVRAMALYQYVFLCFIQAKINISRHTVVCRVAQENGVCANGVSIFTGTTK